MQFVQTHPAMANLSLIDAQLGPWSGQCLGSGLASAGVTSLILDFNPLGNSWPTIFQSWTGIRSHGETSAVRLQLTNFSAKFCSLRADSGHDFAAWVEFCTSLRYIQFIWQALSKRFHVEFSLFLNHVASSFSENWISVVITLAP
jgi:hypothetical protein